MGLDITSLSMAVREFTITLIGEFSCWMLEKGPTSIQ